MGLDTAVQGTGFGAGTWSRGTWGSAATIAAGAVNQLRLWAGDNFGEEDGFDPPTAPNSILEVFRTDKC